MAVRYGFAVAACLLTFAVRASLEPFLLEHSPLLLFTLPVAITAMAAGFGPGLLCAALGSFLGTYFFKPYGVFAVYPDHVRIGVFQMGVFLTVSTLIAKLGGDLRKRQWQAEESAERLRQTLGERDAALERVSVLTGLLPVCASCKSIRDESGHWQTMEAYLSEHSQAKFTHGMCPACMEKWYGEELRQARLG